MSPDKKVTVTEEEYNKLVNTLSSETAIKNTLLTFSFTAVLAILGVALGTDTTKIHPLVFLVPFFLIIPFTARISYYRLASAHKNAFLKVFASERMLFAIGTETVPEKFGIAYRPIAWLVNHEMVLLAGATTAIFWITYYPRITEWGYFEILLWILPLLLDCFVYWISDSTYSYKKIYEVYKPQWERYLDEFQKERKYDF